MRSLLSPIRSGNKKGVPTGVTSTTGWRLRRLGSYKPKSVRNLLSQPRQLPPEIRGRERADDRYLLEPFRKQYLRNPAQELVRYPSPPLARSYAHSWRLADDYPAFSSPYRRRNCCSRHLWIYAPAATGIEVDGRADEGLDAGSCLGLPGCGVARRQGASGRIRSELTGARTSPDWGHPNGRSERRRKANG